MLGINRIILFVKNPKAVAIFYSEKLGLKIRETSEDGKWIDLDAGGIRIGLHAGGKAKRVATNSKIAFFSKNVDATRKKLMATGVKLGVIHEFGDLRFCKGKDPEGNLFQISNRK